MEVRAKKALGQHFLTDLSIAHGIVDALQPALAEGVANGEASELVAGVAVEARMGIRSNPSHRFAAGPSPCRQGGSRPSDAHIGFPDGNSPAKDNQGMLSQPMPTLEIGPGMGVISQYLLEREDLDFKMIEIDRESVDYLLSHFPKAYGRVLEGDFLRVKLDALYPSGPFCIIGNFPYNISSQIFFKILDYKDRIPQVVCMIQKEVAERIAEKPGSKTYGILSVLLQAWYDIEYLFSVGSGAFAPPPKVQSAVIRLRRNSRTSLGCDEALFKSVVKTSFGQRRKTLRNSLKPLIQTKASREGWDTENTASFTSDPVFELRPERLGVEDFIELTRKLQ